MAGQADPTGARGLPVGVGVAQAGAAEPDRPAVSCAILGAVWVWYLTTAILVALIWGREAGPWQGSPWWFLTLHLALLLAMVAGSRRFTGPRSRRVWHGAWGVLGLPVVFSAQSLILPGVHPEPWEWVWIEWDRRICGTDPTVALQAFGAPWFRELLQWCYASFYFVPVAVLVRRALRRRWAQFEAGLVVIVFGFLLCYVGYLWFPTLPPYRFLDHGGEMRFAWMGEDLHRILDRAELHRWDCFPSGHAMLSVTALLLARRWDRWLYVALLPLVLLLVLSTMCLRYHYLVDVLAGLLLAPIALGIGGWLARVPRASSRSNS